MLRTFHKNPDADDMLIAIRRDGNVIKDMHVRQELGMLLSDQHRMAIRNDEMVAFVEWLRGDAPPVGQGNSFFLAEEPEHFTEDSKIINTILPALYNSAATGRTQKQIAGQRARRLLYGIVTLGIVATFVMVFAVIPIFKSPQIVQVPDHVVEGIRNAGVQDEQRVIDVDIAAREAELEHLKRQREALQQGAKEAELEDLKRQREALQQGAIDGSE